MVGKRACGQYGARYPSGDGMQETQLIYRLTECPTFGAESKSRGASETEVGMVGEAMRAGGT